MAPQEGHLGLVKHLAPQEGHLKRASRLRSSLLFAFPYDFVYDSIVRRIVLDINVLTATLACLAVWLATAATASVHEWKPFAPTVAHVHDLAIDPQGPWKVYATTPDGLLLTNDGGATWSRTEEAGIPFRENDRFVVAIDPQDPLTVYAVTSCELSKSVDGGHSWSRIPLADFETCAITDLTIDPQRPTTLYATNDYGGTGRHAEGTIQKSEDAGTVWTDISDGIWAAAFYAVVVDPSQSSTLYAGTSAGVWKSVDGGASWSEARTGLPRRGSVFALAIDSRRPSTLYAGSDDGVYKSSDGGLSWESSPQAELGAPVDLLRIAPDDPDVVYAGTRTRGIHKSRDGGHTWTAITRRAGRRRVKALALHPRDPAIVYAGNHGAGMLKSLDGGDSWRVVETGTRRRATLLALAIGQRFATTFYAGTRNAGVFKSDDEGRTWYPASLGLEADEVTVLTIDLGRPAIVYAGTYGDGVWHSQNGGRSWSPSSRGLRRAEIVALVIDPDVPDSVYAATDRGLYISANGGRSWSRKAFPEEWVWAFAISPHRSSILYASTYEDLYRSTDRGRTWQRIGHDSLPDSGIHAVAPDPRRPGVVYAGTLEGVYKSVDEGRTWIHACEACRAIYQVIVDPRSPSRVYARGYDTIFESLDGGGSWSGFEGRPGNSARTLVLHPWSPSTIYQGGDQLSRPRCGETALCFHQERFTVEVVWRDGRGGTGLGRPAPAWSHDSGVLWFFDEENWEMLVKVLDGCGINDRFWVFAAASTDVEYGLRVTDTLSGYVKSYFNPLGRAAAALTDTAAFATCSR